MNIVELANFLAILNKINIENNPNLSRAEKEYFKQMVDIMKKQVEAGNQQNPFNYKP